MYSTVIQSKKGGEGEKKEGKEDQARGRTTTPSMPCKRGYLNQTRTKLRNKKPHDKPASPGLQALYKVLPLKAESSPETKRKKNR
jgi:hypothetical protein